MKRRDRTLSFFTMSALDVVATATGVFVLLVVILLPYYLQSFDATAETAARRASVADIRREIERIERATTRQIRAADAARAEGVRLAAERAAALRASAVARKQTAALNAEAESRSTDARRLEAFARRTVIRELDLVFVVDTTSSMTRAINEMSQVMRGLIRILERMVPSLRVGIVAYRDYDVGPWVTRTLPLISTRDALARILDFTQRLGPARTGGRSVTEAVYSGLLTAVQLDFRPSAKHVLIVIGDAGAHIGERPATLSLARGFVARGARRSISTLFVTTLTYLRGGRGGREFFGELARVGAGSAHGHAGNMIENVLDSVLAN